MPAPRKYPDELRERAIRLVLDISVQRLRGRSRASAANHTRSAGSYRTRLTWRRSTAFSVREHQ